VIDCGLMLPFSHEYDLFHAKLSSPLPPYAICSVPPTPNAELGVGARRTQTYLIATEDISDTHILKRGLSLLRPDVENFFRFIDICWR